MARWAGLGHQAHFSPLLNLWPKPAEVAQATTDLWHLLAQTKTKEKKGGIALAGIRTQAVPLHLIPPCHCATRRISTEVEKQRR